MFFVLEGSIVSVMTGARLNRDAAASLSRTYDRTLAGLETDSEQPYVWQGAFSPDRMEQCRLDLAACRRELGWIDA